MAREGKVRNLEQRIRELEAELVDCRRLAEEQGRERDHFRTLVQNSLDMVSVVKSDGTIVYETPSIERFLGYVPEELVGKSGFDFVHPEDLESLRVAFSEILLKSGVVEMLECRFRHKDGSWRTLEGVYKNMLDEPAVEGVIINVRDITERKQAEAAQRESEQRFRAIFEGCLDAILLVDPDSGRILDANPAASHLTGFPHDVLAGLHHTGLYPPRLRESAERVFAEQVMDRQAEAMETVVLCRGGTERPVEVLGQIIQIEGVPVLYSTLRDVTRRKRAERRWRESLETSRVILEAIEDVALLIDTRGVILEANEPMAAKYGKRLDEVIGRCAYDLFSPELAERRRGYLEEIVRTRRSLHFEDKHNQRWFDHRMFPVLNEEGEVSRLAIITRDITERKKMEKALRESERMYRTFVRISPEAIIIIDPAGTIVDVSNQMLEIAGFSSAGEVIGRTVFDFIAPEDHTRGEENIRRTIEEGYTAAKEYRALRKDGTRYTACMSSVALRDAQGNPKVLMTSVRDVTREDQIREQMLKTQKLESVGMLAGGIAHDFNNFLTSILANLSMARISGGSWEEISGMLGDAVTACLRAKRLTEQLLAFSKGGAPIRKPTPIARSLRKTVEFVLSGSNLRCDYAVAEDLWLADIDEGQIYQVIQNLVVNAKQAMSQGGVLRISAENVTLAGAGPLPLKPGRYVRVSVTDQGPGIPQQHLDRLFSPYFTTKEEGRGLGLAISYAVVRNHGGLIKVDSRVGAGTTFDIFLPASGQTVKSEPKARPEPLQGQGRVLVVDDDELILGSCGKVLKHLGYEVGVARDGREGLKLYEEAAKKGQAFDVVIMDLTIPGGTGGREAAQALLELDPRARVVVSSGYFNDPVMSNFREYGFSGVLAKPYRIEDLGRAVRDAMNPTGGVEAAARGKRP